MNNIASYIGLGSNSSTPNPNGDGSKWWKNPKVILILGILYCVSPIDVIPDVIPVAGWFDDVGVIAYVIRTLMAGRKDNDTNNA